MVLCGRGSDVLDQSRSLIRLGSLKYGRCSSSRASSSDSYMNQAKKLDQVKEDIMFVIFSCDARYEFWAYNQSGEKIDERCFTIDLGILNLPLYSGFAVLGSTLYMIGGDLCSSEPEHEHACGRNTYEINLDEIPQLHGIPLPSACVKPGPCLKGRKEIPPRVIVVGSRIYVFSRLISPVIRFTTCEFLDTNESVQEWTKLPGPPFPANLEIKSLDYAEIVSHVVDKEQAGIIVCLSYGFYSSVCRLDIRTHKWSILSFGSPPPVYGKVVSMAGANYAFYNPRMCWDDRVCVFNDIIIPDKKQVANLETSPAVTSWCRDRDMGLLGDTLFLVRVGSKSGRDAKGRLPVCHLAVDTFQICMGRETAEAISFCRKMYKIKYPDLGHELRSVCCVSFCRVQDRALDREVRFRTTRALDREGRLSYQ